MIQSAFNDGLEQGKEYSNGQLDRLGLKPSLKAIDPIQIEVERARKLATALEDTALCLKMMATNCENLQKQRDLYLRGLGLSVRARKACARIGVHTVRALACVSESDLAGVKYCGPQTIRELRELLAHNGLSFRDDKKYG